MEAPHDTSPVLRFVDWRDGIPNPSAGFGLMKTTIPNVVKRLWHSVAAPGRRPQGGTSEDGWGIVVDQVIADLETLNSSTERDFLAVGEKLMEFRSTARQIASDMTALTELISGEHGRNASTALTKILEHSRGMDAGIEQSGQTLGRVHDHACRIRLAFGGLRNTVAVFRTLCTLTRIETSRLGSSGADFGDLAAEVGPLSESIQASGEGVLEASATLDQCVQSAIRGASDLRVKQLKELGALIAGVVDSLEAFEERRRQAAETSAREAAEYEALCSAVDGVVRSVQFHDITRQQVEHVVQALGQLRSAWEIAHGGTVPAGSRAILALQSSQLGGAAELFATSMEGMEHDLESIGLRVQEMAKASRTLTGISTDDQNSFFLQMEGQFTAILKMLDTCAAAQREVESTAASLEKTISSMQDSVGEIRGIEIRIQRIATNATIRATHIGTAGNALNVIAEVMQRLALDSNANTEDVAQTLAAMSDAAKSVSGHAGTYAVPNEVVGEMQRAVLGLHTSSECSFSRVNQISALGARLAEDIGAVRNGFSAGSLFAQVADRARGELDRLGAKAGSESLEGVEDAPTEQLESLTKRYTMQMERDVHEALTGGAAIAPAPADAPGVTLAEDDLGDNVELF